MFLGKKSQELSQEDKHLKSAMTLCSTYLETFPLSEEAKTHKFLGPTEYLMKCSTNLQWAFFNVKHGMGWFIIWSQSDWVPNLAKQLLQQSISKAPRKTYLPERSSIM